MTRKVLYTLKTPVQFFLVLLQVALHSVCVIWYLTLSSVSSLYNSQNSENEILCKYEVDMLKIIIIIAGYTLNNFTTHITIL